VLQGMLALYRGDLNAASASRDEILEVYGGGRRDDRHLFSSVEIMMALIDMAEGRPAEAAAHLEANLKSLQLMRAVAAQAAAEARLATGEPDRAVELAALLASPPSYGPWADATSQWIRGMAAAAHDEDNAVVFLRAAADQLDALGLSFPAAAAWLDWARVAPDDRAAIEVLTERLSFLDGIGARPLADRARAQLRERGVRPSRAAAEAAGPLSPRELEVASLVAEGLGNAEIAQRLFISPRTVTTHLHHVYERLGISSRTALARWFMEQSPRADTHSLARNT
jgi:DNA-binding CsgD family transcriptional regulator